MLKYLEIKHKFHEGLGGFRLGRSCIDNIFPLMSSSKAALRKINPHTFFIDVKKTYDTVGKGKDGLSYKMWEMDFNGKMWRVIRTLYVKN